MGDEKTRGDSDENSDDRPPLYPTLTCTLDDWIANRQSQKPCRYKCINDALKTEGYVSPVKYVKRSKPNEKAASSDKNSCWSVFWWGE